MSTNNSADNGYDLPLTPTPEEAFADFFGAARPDDSVFWVYEVNEHGKAPAQLFHFPYSERGTPAEFSDDLLERFGYGHYEIVLRDVKGAYLAKQRLTLGSERDRRRARAPSASDAPSAPPAAPAAAPEHKNDDLPPALAAILESQTRLISTLIESVTRARDPAPAPAAPASSQMSLLELLRELKGVRELFGGGDAAGGVTSTLGLLREVWSLRDELGGGAPSGDGSPFAAVMHQLAPALSKALDRLGDAPPQTAGAAQPARIAKETPTMNIADWLVPLVNMAAEGAEPERAAQAVIAELEQKPSYVWDYAVGMIHEEPDKARTFVLSLAPALANHSDWLNAVLEQVRVQTRDGEQPSDQATGSVNGAAASP